MDCEKFESVMMDELYGELDELTSAAAKRHVAGCARCAALLGGLRATRRVATMPLVAAPAGLEERILVAAREAQKVVPLRRGLAHAVSLAGTWAMRPQTAMAALFLVMIGTSVLLLRGKSARAPESANVTVTERGAPAPEASVAPEVHDLSPAPAATAFAYGTPAESKGTAGAAAGAADVPGGEAVRARAPARLAAPAKDDEGTYAMQNGSSPGGPANALPQAAPAAPPPAPGTFDTAVQLYQAGRFDEATRAFDALASSDPNAGLWAARSVREGKGCRAALGRFDRATQHAPGTPPAWDALLEGGLCYRTVGDFTTARQRFTSLLNVDSHKDRARAELDRLDRIPQAASPPSVRAAPKAAATGTPNSAADPSY